VLRLLDSKLCRRVDRSRMSRFKACNGWLPLQDVSQFVDASIRHCLAKGLFTPGAKLLLENQLHR